MSTAIHPASARAERLLTRIIEQLAMWGRGAAVRLRPVEIAEVSRWAVEARQEVVASRSDPEARPIRDHISAAVRRRVLARAGGRCEACDRAFGGETPHVDHVVPVARYGVSSEDNLRALCERCNLTKGAREAS